MKIRKAMGKDLDQVFALVQELATSFKPRKKPFETAFRQTLDKDTALLLVAERNKEIVGYCLSFDHYAFYANGRVTWLEELIVREDYRGGGIGRALMEQVEQWAESRKSKSIALATRRADDFYRAIGYEESARFFRKLIH